MGGRPRRYALQPRDVILVNASARIENAGTAVFLAFFLRLRALCGESASYPESAHRP